MICGSQNVLESFNPQLYEVKVMLVLLLPKQYNENDCNSSSSAKEYDRVKLRRSLDLAKSHMVEYTWSEANACQVPLNEFLALFSINIVNILPEFDAFLDNNTNKLMCTMQFQVSYYRQAR